MSVWFNSDEHTETLMMCLCVHVFWYSCQFTVFKGFSCFSFRSPSLGYCFVSPMPFICIYFTSLSKLLVFCYSTSRFTFCFGLHLSPFLLHIQSATASIAHSVSLCALLMKCALSKIFHSAPVKRILLCAFGYHHTNSATITIFASYH